MLIIFIQIYDLGGVDVCMGIQFQTFAGTQIIITKISAQIFQNFQKLPFWIYFWKKTEFKKTKNHVLLLEPSNQTNEYIYILIIYRLEFCVFSALKMSKYIRTFPTSKVNFKINRKIIEKLSFACCFHKIGW